MKRVLRIVGLTLITIVAAFYLFILIGSLFEGEPITFGFESVGMAVLISLTVISVVFVWIKPSVGVWMVLAVGVLFSIFGVITAGQRKWMAVLAAGGPLIAGGALMLVGRKKRE